MPALKSRRGQARELVISAGRVTSDGRRIYRMTRSLVLWWAWIVILIVAVVDVVASGKYSVPANVVLIMASVTGIIFATALWPKVIADDTGVTVRNPFRTTTIPWGAVLGVSMTEWVEILGSQGDGKPDKAVYSWALPAPRRARVRAAYRSGQWREDKRAKPAGYLALPDEAKQAMRKIVAEHMARELAQLAQDAAKRSEAREVGADGPAQSADKPVLRAAWAWLPLASVLLPVAGLIAVLVAA